MSGDTSKIYTVQGTEFQTTESIRAIQKAKEKAIADKQPKKVFLNGNPYALVDRRGNLVAA